jgi:hypothetical protein
MCSFPAPRTKAAGKTGSRQKGLDLITSQFFATGQSRFVMRVPFEV